MTYTTLLTALTMAVSAGSLGFLAFQVSATAAANRPISSQAKSDIVGPARVIDGDTLEIHGLRVRLEGIDAPERAQRCARAWWPGKWRCGRGATRALSTLVAGKQVRCQSHGKDKYGRMIGVCFVAGRDINAVMVRDGYAWAFVKYSESYVVEEQAARAEKRGIWRAPTQTAWDFRAKKWSTSEQIAPNGCAIKGNITSRGRIYHMPWSPWYSKVRIDQRRGERWFCSEAAAQAEGWRPIQGHKS